MGLTQGLLSAMVADAAPSEIRGTAFGVFHMIAGIMLLAASLIAGLLWDKVGPSATFYAGIAFTAAALAGLMAVRRHGTIAS
jgi:MFS family permease